MLRSMGFDASPSKPQRRPAQSTQRAGEPLRGGDKMQRLAALAAVVRAPRSLAVDGDNVGVSVAQLLDPGHKAGLEERGVERVDDVVEGIMGGKAIVER